MKNNRETYKRVKINWWLILLFLGVNGGLCVWMIFAYIHQWGNNPIPNKTFLTVSVTIFVLATIVPLIFVWRFKVTIDDKFVIFKVSLAMHIKISIVNIKNVSVKQVSWTNLYISEKNTEKFYFGFVKQAVKIQMINGKTYEIGIRNAEKIKEEIEKRMITTK